MDIAKLVEDFGFVAEMKTTIIRLTDQLRLLDQDMIRLQIKVNTVLELKELDEKEKRQ